MTREHQADDGRRFGRFLRRVREDRKLSLDAAAELTARLPGRVTKSHLSRIENGTAEPTFPRMFSLARVYGVPIAQFAERFEADLRRSLVTDGVHERPSDVLFDDAEALRAAGRHDEALIRYELLLDRLSAEGPGDPSRQGPATLRLRRAGCLSMLACYASAKEETEELLMRPDLTADERATALQLFVQCCYRLERYSFALMALRQSEEVVAELPPDSRHHAHLLHLKGVLHFVMGDAQAAVEAFHDAIERYERVGPDYEVCRARTNYAQALAESGHPNEAGRQLRAALEHAESRGYARTQAIALNALGALAFGRHRLDAAESYCLRSNRIARERDYQALVFCNCYYLWKVALERGDAEGAAGFERTLIAYVGKVPDQVGEARSFRKYLAGGAP